MQLVMLEQTSKGIKNFILGCQILDVVLMHQSAVKQDINIIGIFFPFIRSTLEIIVKRIHPAIYYI